MLAHRVRETEMFQSLQVQVGDQEGGSCTFQSEPLSEGRRLMSLFEGSQTDTGNSPSGFVAPFGSPVDWMRPTHRLDETHPF